jgi:hypothetical protein
VEVVGEACRIEPLAWQNLAGQQSAVAPEFMARAGKIEGRRAEGRWSPLSISR